jgi:hypothetical protein
MTRVMAVAQQRGVVFCIGELSASFVSWGGGRPLGGVIRPFLIRLITHRNDDGCNCDCASLRRPIGITFE